MPDDIKLPERMGLDAIRQCIEERDEFERMYRELANEMAYEGNSVQHWHSKAKVYGQALDEAWKALRDAGIAPSDGASVAEGVRKLLAALNDARAAVAADRAQQAAEIERLRTDAERYRWLRSLEWFAEAEIGIELDGSAWRVTFSSPAPFENASGGSWLDAAIDAARKEADRA